LTGPGHVCSEKVLYYQAPAGPPPEYTTFAVIECTVCRNVTVFPEDNYRLTTPAFREQFESALTARGARLVSGR
jgi:hypothetical protein